MRFGIAAKLALLLALVGVLAAGIASFHGFWSAGICWLIRPKTSC